MAWRQLASEWLAGKATTAAQFHAQNFIGGEFCAAAAGATIDVTAPATGRKIGTIPRSAAADVDAAAQAAQRALKGKWGRMGAEQRSAVMNRLADGLEKNARLLGALESVDQGKTITLAAARDVPRCVQNIRFFASAILHGNSEAQHMGEPRALNYTQHSPVGVVGLITPWNLPLYLLTWKVGPALAMGNTIVAKPSELSPFTAAALCDIAKEAGLPDGVLNIVHGYGQDCGQAIVEHPLTKAVSFTGGTATGRLVARTAAPMFKKLSLELGGKNATVVFDDCDFEAAVSGALFSAFANQGEICLCGSRLLVQRGVYDRFVAEFVRRARQMVPGNPTDPKNMAGSLISEAHRQKVLSYVKLAKELGGTVECGGAPPQLEAPFDKGAFLSPTVITGLPHDSRVSCEEIFGPVVTVHPFDTAQEAVDIANETQYGLAGSVWTQDINKGHMVAQAIETGMVWVNCWLVRDLRVPFGGVKASGVGREGGHRSLEFFSEAKNICVALPAKL